MSERDAFTPEPWRISGGGRDVVSDHHGYNGLIAAVYSGGREAGDCADAEQKANVDLILAAPALLDAVRHLCYCLEKVGIFYPDANAMISASLFKGRDAITKATGEKP